MSGWGPKFETVVMSYPGGVKDTPMGDLINPDTAPHAENASWERIGNGTAVVEKRLGATLINTGTSVDAAIIGQLFYQKRNTSSGVLTAHHILVAQDGDLHTLNTSTGVVTNHTSGEFTTTITTTISGLVANNHAYVVSGVAGTAGGVTGYVLRFDGTNWRVAGMAAPAAPTAVVNVAAGSMNGTYEVGLTYYNSATGYESSRSTTSSAAPANQKIDVSWVAPTDAQVTHVRVHVRKGTLSTGFYQATSIAVPTTSVTLNISDADYNALITLSPDEDENDPPPTDTKYLAWHRSRLFAGNDKNVYYSKVELPEAFDPEKYEPVNPDDGQKIRGIVSAFDQLVVFKDFSTYALVGVGPNDWQLVLISRKVGCVAPGSIVYTGGLLYWWSSDGPVVWDGIQEPRAIGKEFIARSIPLLYEGITEGGSALSTGTYHLGSMGLLNASRLYQIVATDDPRQERIMWSIPLSGDIRNSVVIPFKYRLGAFEGIWLSFEHASYMVGVDTAGLEWVYVGGYNGRVYKWWAGSRDGVPTGAVTSGTVTATGRTITTLPGVGLDTGTGYVGLYVTLVETDSGRVIDRQRVDSNTATALTLVTALSGTTSGTNYTYYIGGVDFLFDTKWQDDQASFYKKRWEFLYLQCQVETTTKLLVDINTDWGTGRERRLSLDVTPGSVNQEVALWDVAKWDLFTWPALGPVGTRNRVALTGQNWRARIRHSNPLSGFALYKVGIRGEYLTDKR